MVTGNNTRERILTAVIFAVIMVPVLVFSDTVAFPVVMGLVGAVCVFELLSCTQLIKRPVFAALTELFAVALPACTYFGGSKWLFITVLLFIIVTVSYEVITEQTEIMSRVYSALFIILYVVIGFSSIVYLRRLGLMLVLFIFLTAWFTDIFAYVSGYFFGKHKLIPKLSPNKTVEGAVGGIAMTVVSNVVIGIIYGVVKIDKVNFVAIIILSLIASCMAQIGDLAMSQVKRYYKIKDFGNLLPGHGGFLDRFDSVVAVSVTTMIFCLAFSSVRLF